MKKLMIGIIGLLLLIFGAYQAVFSHLNQTEQFSIENMKSSEEMLKREAKSNIINIALFGLDQREHGFDGNTRSDAIKIVSIDTKNAKIKINSIQRDLLMLLPNGELDKLNHAYWIGGAELALQTINQNFDLDVTRYVTVNYDGIEQLIDQVGGVEINLLKAELDDLNGYIRDLNALASGDQPVSLIEEAGTQMLNGRQAVAYMRIRYVGSDYARMRRQTRVIEALANQIKSLNYVELLELLPIALSFVETNLQMDEMLSLLPVGMKVDFSMIESYQLPTTDFDETIAIRYKEYEPVYLLKDYVKLASDIHQNIYGYVEINAGMDEHHKMIYDLLGEYELVDDVD